MHKNLYIDPWLKLMARRHRTRERHLSNPYTSATDLDRALQKERQRFLGSDLSLMELVQQQEQPAEESIVRLSKYLSKRTAYFLLDEKWNYPVDVVERFCYRFFYYTLQLYARCKIKGECIDNLILMADAFVIDPDNLGFVLETALYDECDEQLVRDCWNWIMDYYPPVPNFFRKCVQAAVAVLTGVMPDPLARN